MQAKRRRAHASPRKTYSPCLSLSLLPDGIGLKIRLVSKPGAQILPLLALVFGLAITTNANASCTGSSPTWTSTPDQASVTTCVSNALSGDTINVAAGSATWSAITITKAIHLVGAGIGNTVITQTGAVSFLPAAGEETKTFELAGFTFQGSSNHFDETAWGKLPAITSLKVHDNLFTGSTNRAVFLAGLEFGVFYHNTFTGNVLDISVIGAGVANGNFFALCFGCANYPYFEDNTFPNGTNSGFISETGQGGRLVMRHNTISNYGGGEVYDVHGEQNSGGWTATSEYYENTITTTTACFRWMHLRGGQALIMNNTITRSGGGPPAFNITEYQDHGGNGICNGYPIAYNSSEQYCTPISATCLETQIHNSFFFNELANGSQQSTAYTQANGGSCGADPPWGDDQYVKQNREFWLPTFGLESALPATCSADGNTYYGTTDTDKIFKCTATNSWTLFYQPYTYPHPLRSASGTGTPPASPTGLTAIVH